MEPNPHECDHDLLISMHQKCDDTIKRIDVHATQIMGLFALIPTTIGIMLILLYQFVLPSYGERLRALEKDHEALMISDDAIRKELKLEHDRIDHLYDMYGSKKAP